MNHMGKLLAEQGKLELPAYKRIVFNGQIRNKTRTGESCCSSGSPENRPLHEIPCSSGKACAEVLIITDPSQRYDTSGKILVTTSAAPGWVFLLAQAAGIIGLRNRGDTAAITYSSKYAPCPHIVSALKNRRKTSAGLSIRL